jgi:phosphoglycolate phosphatase-like HAD superfamily hydrolase
MVKLGMVNKNLVLIFDFDGTIADTINFAKKNFDFPGRENINWQELRNKGAKEAFKSLGISLIRIPFVLNQARQILYQKIDRVKLVKGMDQALAIIGSKGYRLGILTSCAKDTVEKFLRINQLSVFEFVYSEKNIFNKANKLNRLLKKNKLDPQNVFYIGDETRDMEAAKEVGVRTVAVTWGFNSEKALLERQPDYLIRKPGELVALLDNF